MKDNFWTVFHDTGDPMCYLLWKGMERDKRAEDLQEHLIKGAD